MFKKSQLLFLRVAGVLELRLEICYIRWGLVWFMVIPGRLPA